MRQGRTALARAGVRQPKQGVAVLLALATVVSASCAHLRLQPAISGPALVLPAPNGLSAARVVARAAQIGLLGPDFAADLQWLRTRDLLCDATVGLRAAASSNEAMRSFCARVADYHREVYVRQDSAPPPANLSLAPVVPSEVLRVLALDVVVYRDHEHVQGDYDFFAANPPLEQPQPVEPPNVGELALMWREAAPYAGYGIHTVLLKRGLTIARLTVEPYYVDATAPGLLPAAHLATIRLAEALDRALQE